jgi:hypothetical protein
VRSTWLIPAWRALAPSGMTCALLAGCGDPAATCVDDATFFKEQVYPQVIEETCLACHTADGVARSSDLVFVGPARPDHFEVNRALLAEVAGLQRDGESLVLRKPRGDDAHGGGAVLAADSEAYELLETFVGRVAQPVTCAGDQDVIDADAGLVLASPAATLRKAALLLAGRLPTTDEIERVRSGGEPALVDALWEIMASVAFADRMVELLNDVFLTERYKLGSTDAIGIFDDDRFEAVYWYEDAYDGDYYTLRAFTNNAIAEEPLALARHILRNDLPWTELLTADYTMVNAYSARAYGVDIGQAPDPRDPASLTFRPVQVPDFPHAGLLTTPAFLNRWPTTPTNRNRHRAWFYFKTFLATDILTFADRPIDPTISDKHNPTLNDAQCTVCHATMDPVAGTFQSWDEEGRFAPPEDGWYAEMATPGFADQELPATERPQALRWLAAQTIADPRFAVATVRMVLEQLTGLELLTALTAGTDPERRAALAQQDAWVQKVADEFAARGHDLKYVVEQVVRSRYFRTIAEQGAVPGALEHAGTARLLTPEELDRKIIATLGYPWREAADRENLLLDDYLMLYGGIDSFSVTERLRDPNGVMAAVALRMATRMACEVVPRDFLLPLDQRRLFPHVEPTWAPLTPDGFAVPEVESLIRENVRWLHFRLLGEELAPGGAEEDATYALFLQTWQEGRAGVLADELDDALPGDCRVYYDFWSGEELPSSMRVEYDDEYLLRAWMAVLTYLLTDYRFLFE